MSDSFTRRELKPILENTSHDLDSILVALKNCTADLKEVLPILRESYQTALSHNLLGNKQVDLDKIKGIEPTLTELIEHIQDTFKSLDVVAQT